MAFKKRRYSGVCLCGHTWDEHHLSLVFNQQYIRETNEGSLPGPCLHYGFNELEGLGPDGETLHE